MTINSVVTAGWLTRAEIAAELGGVHLKSVERYERQGLPVIRIGNLRFYDPAAVRDWIVAQGRRARARPAAKQTAVWGEHATKQDAA